jgi:DNA polymerase III alpha subunit (gram-positive type)
VIVFDTETTGLIQHPSTPLERQPEIIEFCGVRLNDATMEVVGEPLLFLCKPRTPALDPKITQITGLTLDDLKDAKSWAANLPQLEQFFIGERACVAHNCSYDIGMMTLEQQRLNRVNRFPWPTEQICTVDATKHIKGHRLKLGELYEYLFSEPMGVAHRAEVDVMNLVRVVQELRTRALI